MSMPDLILEDLLVRYPALVPCKRDIEEAYEALVASFRKGHKLLLCGNGGSAADCDHIVGELMKGFMRPRRLKEPVIAALCDLDAEKGSFLSDKLQMGLPAISLVTQTALLSAVANDLDGSLIFAQQVMALGKAGDVLLCISTSGESANLLYAAQTAKAVGMKVIALTGRTGGALRAFSHPVICVPGATTPEIQELHLPVYHALCRMIEDTFFL